MPRSASTGMAVERLADDAARQRRAAPDHPGQRALGALAAAASHRGADVAVTELALLRPPRELERAQALLVPVRAAEVEPLHAALAAPPDRLPEQQVVGAQREEARVGRAVLVEQRVAVREEHPGGHRLALAPNEQHEAEPGLEQRLEAEDEAPRLRRHAEPSPGDDVQAEERLERRAIRRDGGLEALALRAPDPAAHLRLGKAPLDLSGVRAEREYVVAEALARRRFTQRRARAANLERHAAAALQLAQRLAERDRGAGRGVAREQRLTQVGER